MDKISETTYDQVPYPGLSYAQSHPDCLATMATLVGMSPAPVEHCRVLELGCASGWNLIPMAYGLPQSEFLGIDNSLREIAEGQTAIDALGLGNIALRHLDILDVRPDLGQFDYVIVHGVFSWVPPHVQDKILQVCKQNLAPNGVAYVSYNTYPGWHMLGIIRDMMLYHTRELGDPEARAAQARALLSFLADSVPTESGAYGSFLNMYARFLQGKLKGEDRRGNSLLLHDELEEVNEPIYFHQFAEQAARHGLQYLGETELRTMLDSNFPPPVCEQLREMARSVVDLEQYMDFLRNQTFRKTLLCHQDLALSRTLRPGQMTSFWVASCARPVAADPDPDGTTVVQFRVSDGSTLSTDHPVTKAAMSCLADIFPQAVKLDVLQSMAYARLGTDMARQDELTAHRDAQVLAANLLRAHAYSGNLVELHVCAVSIALNGSERPRASAVARLQARSSAQVTNLRHERVELDELNQYLLPYLDGDHDRAALVRALEAGPLADGTLVIQQDGQPVENAEVVRELLGESVTARVQWLAHAGLLVG